jgi:hypothetical protein
MTAASHDTAIVASPGVHVFVGSMADIREALRARFDTLELARITIDAAAGLADGHASKLLAEPPIRRFSDVTLWPVLQVAGLRLALVEDPETAARAAKLKKRVQHKVRYQAAGTARMIAASRPTVLRELGAKGGKARMEKLTSAGRRRLAKLAARARWAKRKGGL